MSTVIKLVKGEYYEIELNQLYKTRQDNNLSTDLLVSKYTNRIVDGTLNGVRKLEGWEQKAQEVIDILKQVNKDIADINTIYRNGRI
ncbi:MAG: hypothetical protein ACR2M7_06040 [Bdellovibrionales bacterium]